MDTCPYCDSEIESGATLCPSCGRYLAVQVIGHEERPGSGHGAGGQFRQTVYVGRGGCGCCGARMLAAVCMVAGFWRWQFWLLAAVLLLFELVGELRRR